jgi:hypothetical protein
LYYFIKQYFVLIEIITFLQLSFFTTFTYYPDLDWVSLFLFKFLCIYRWPYCKGIRKNIIFQSFNFLCYVISSTILFTGTFFTIIGCTEFEAWTNIEQKVKFHTSESFMQLICWVVYNSKFKTRSQSIISIHEFS